MEKYATPLSIIGAGIIIAISFSGSPTQKINADSLQESVLPSDGVTLPVTWGDLGANLAEAGAIEPAKLEALYKDRGGFPPEYKKMIEEN
ncbi:hypothetical protein HYT04_02015, partial [Candidatus Kaiserbacteria bacterium]|nr:hypothetical protein [Candidatus Kaiserbacteria bacterium]